MPNSAEGLSNKPHRFETSARRGTAEGRNVGSEIVTTFQRDQGKPSHSERCPEAVF